MKHFVKFLRDYSSNIKQWWYDNDVICYDILLLYMILHVMIWYNVVTNNSVIWQWQWYTHSFVAVFNIGKFGYNFMCRAQLRKQTFPPWTKEYNIIFILKHASFLNHQYIYSCFGQAELKFDVTLYQWELFNVYLQHYGCTCNTMVATLTPPD